MYDAYDDYYDDPLDDAYEDDYSHQQTTMGMDDDEIELEMNKKRREGLKAIDMELKLNYSDLSATELAKLREKKIRDLEIELYDYEQKLLNGY